MNQEHMEIWKSQKMLLKKLMLSLIVLDGVSESIVKTQSSSTASPTVKPKELSNAAKGGLIATGLIIFIFALFGVIYCRRAKAYASNLPSYYNDIRLNRPTGMGNDEYEEESDCEPLFEDHLVIG